MVEFHQVLVQRRLYTSLFARRKEGKEITNFESWQVDIGFVEDCSTQSFLITAKNELQGTGT